MYLSLGVGRRGAARLRFVAETMTVIELNHLV